jgi:hypothetical protein
MRLLIPCAALALCAAGPLRAQAVGPAAPHPEVGDRVRLEMRDGVRIVGIVTALGRDTIRLRGDRAGATATFPLTAVRGYETSAGRDRRRGAWAGALVGGVLGAGLVAFALHEDATAQGDYMITATMVAVPAAVALVLAGAGVGALVAPERWTAPMPARAGGPPAARGGSTTTPSSLRAEPVVGVAAGVPGLGAGSPRAAALAGLQLGRRGGGRTSPTLAAAYAYAPRTGECCGPPGGFTYDDQAALALAGLSRELGAARRVALTAELGVEAYNQIRRGAVPGFTPGPTRWHAAPLTAAGVAYRRPAGRRLEVLVHGRAFVGLSTGLGLPVAQPPQPALTIGVSRR